MRQTMKLGYLSSEAGRGFKGCYVAWRYVFAFFGFFGCIVSYAARSNISVAMVAMVKSLPKKANGSEECRMSNFNASATNETSNYWMPSSDRGEFDWDEELQGVILGGFFWGYMIPQVLGGRLAERFSAKKVVLIGPSIGILATLLGPIAARTHVGFFIATRVLCGLGFAVLTPAFHCLIARWSHPMERSRIAAFVYSGSQFGVIVSLPIAGLVSGLDSDGGWPWAFYIFGILGVVWLVLWMVFVYDSPAEHPWISDAEREYLETGLGKEVNSEKPPVPWKHLVKSKPLWSLTWVHFGHNWSFYTLLTQLPSYMDDVLGFDVKASGLFSSLPFAMMMVYGILNSFVADYLIRKKIFSVAAVRKACNTIALYGSAACLLSITFLNCQTKLIYALLVLAVGLDGGIYAGYQVNQVDLSPNFAGTLQAITNTVGCIPGIVSPYVTGVITNEEQTQERWSIVFYITFAIVVVFATQYWVFGSGEVQYWNNLNVNSAEEYSLPPRPPSAVEKKTDVESGGGGGADQEDLKEQSEKTS